MKNCCAFLIVALIFLVSCQGGYSYSEFGYEIDYFLTETETEESPVIAGIEQENSSTTL